MLTFPILNTGSVAQYPLSVSESFDNEVLQFLGGDEQRYRVTPGRLLAWTIRLDLLAEDELNSIEQFFMGASGSLTTFSFTDPASATAYANCYISNDSMEQIFAGELRSGSTLVIQQGR